MRRRLAAALALALAEALAPALAAPAAEPIVVGSKTFTESYVLGEIMAQLLEARGFTVERRLGLGGTLICYEALAGAEIDVYPEYTGTIRQAILGLDALPAGADLDALLGRRGLQTLAPFGFDNTYAIAMKAELAAGRGIERISDLKGADDLRLAFTHEFLNRRDGWPGLRAAYDLEVDPRGIEHGLAYQAIDQGRIDVTDAYATDGDLERYGLAVLADERGYFPDYRALPLARADLPAAAAAALNELAGRLDEQRMRALNAQVVVEGRSFAAVARGFLEGEGLAEPAAAEPGRGRLLDDLLRNTLTHLKLTGIALGLACALGLPAALAAYRSARASNAILYAAGLLQTIPSIALLALMIPLFGIGTVPAIVALFVYSLLPILRNTITALITIDPIYRRMGAALGLTEAQQLRYLLLPLALPGVLAGVRMAAVISIGTATLAAFIGAGGLGEPIVTGLTLNDPQRILEGAVPAACLAILTELAFELLERALVPAHLLTRDTGTG